MIIEHADAVHLFTRKLIEAEIDKTKTSLADELKIELLIKAYKTLSLDELDKRLSL